MTALNDRFWARVLFKEFIKHYRKLTDEQIVADVRQSMDDLEELVDGTTSFGSKMVRWSMERADRYPQASENGKKGGRPRKDKESTAGAPTREDGVDRKSGTPATISHDASTRKGEDDSKARTSCTVSSSNPSVRPSLAYAGRGGNVRLTDDEYAMLLQELGNKRKADKLIDSLDYAISEGKTFNAPHFHVLMHWNDYREEKAEERAQDMKVKAEAFAEASKKQGLKSNADKMDEMMAGAKHLIDMYRLPEVKNG